MGYPNILCVETRLMSIGNLVILITQILSSGWAAGLGCQGAAVPDAVTSLLTFTCCS